VWMRDATRRLHGAPLRRRTPPVTMGTIVHIISTNNYRRRHAFQPTEHRF
jgi:hypothetical protein